MALKQTTSPPPADPPEFTALLAEWREIGSFDVAGQDTFRVSLGDVAERRFFKACQHWLQHAAGDLTAPVSAALLAEWFPDDLRRRVARAHLRCVVAGLQHFTRTASREALEDISADLELPLHLVLGIAADLGARALLESETQPLEASRVNVMLVADQGYPFVLVLEARRGNRPALYAAPAFSLIQRDSTWLQTERDVYALFQEAGLWPENWEVAWSLVSWEGKQPGELEGPSAGLAFFMGLGKLIAQPSRLDTLPFNLSALRGLDLSGVVFSAALQRAAPAPGGRPQPQAKPAPDTAWRLGQVSRVFDKVSQSILFHSIVVAEEQRAALQPTPLDGPANHRVETLQFLYAETPAQAVQATAQRVGALRGAIQDCREVLDDPQYAQFDPRPEVLEPIEEFLHGDQGGYRLLVADPWFGKTAIACHLVRQLTAAPPPGWRLAYHFLRRGYGLDAPDRALRSLIAQIRLGVGLADDQKIPAGQLADEFQQTLRQAAERLAAAGGDARLIVLMDGLDETFGPLAEKTVSRLFPWPDLLPRLDRLPEPLQARLRFVLLGRPGDYLGWLNNPAWQLSLSPSGRDTPERMAACVHLLAQRQKLKISEGLLRRIAENAEGLLGLACEILRGADLADRLPAWEKDPALVPRGWEGVFADLWKRLEAKAAKAGVPRSVVARTLCWIAQAREPLSLNMLAEVLPPSGQGRQRVDPVRQVLSLAAEFLTPGREAAITNGGTVRVGAEAPHRFFHAQFAEMVLRTEHNLCGITSLELDDWRRQFADACLARWDDPKSKLRPYALPHLPGHLAELGDGETLAGLLLDFSYLRARMESAGERPERRIYDLLRDFDLALHGPCAGHESLAEVRRALDARSHLLAVHPDRLLEQIQHDRDWSTAASQQMHQSLKKALSGWHPAVWLKRLNWDGFEGTSPLLRTLTGHRGPVNSVVYSPDGRTLASAGQDGAIRLWDAATGRPRGEPLTGHTDRIESLVYSPDGQTLASAGMDRTIRLWDAATGRPRGEPLTGHTDGILSVVYSPDGQTLASAGMDRTIRLWDAATGQPRGQPLTGHTGWIRSVVYSPDGQTLASADWEGTIRLWDLARGGSSRELLTGHRSLTLPFVLLSVVYSPDGRTLASAGDDGTIRLWDAATGRAQSEPLTGHTGRIRSVVYSPDGNTLASADSDGTIRLWDAATGRPRGKLLTGHTGRVTSVVFSPDGQTLASADSDGTIRLWDAVAGRPQGEPLTGHTGRIWSVVFSPDGQTLASIGHDRTIRLCDVTAGRPRCEPLTGHTGSIWSVMSSPDARTGEPLTGPTGSIWSIVFSPDGRTLATASGDGTIRLWDAATGRPRGEPLTATIRRSLAPRHNMPLTGHTGYINSVVYSPDGQTLASAGKDGAIRLWDAATGRPRGEPLTGHTFWINSVVYSPDGQTLASAGEDRTIRLWDVATGQLRAEPLPVHTAGITSVVFSPDRKTLASADWDGTIRLWDVATGRPRGKPLTEHRGAIFSVVYSPDGQTLVSAGSDGTIRLWDARPGGLIDSAFLVGLIHQVQFAESGSELRAAVEDAGHGRIHAVQFQLLRPEAHH